MSKLIKKLQANECVIFKGKVHSVTIIIPFILMCIFCLVGIRGAFGIEIWIFFSVSLIWFLCRLCIMSAVSVALTNRRFVGQFGLLSSGQMECTLNKIDSISIKKGILGEIFGYGTLSIYVGGIKYEFNDIAKVDEVRYLIMEQVENYNNASM